jgi:hypothetical protein
MKSAAIFSLIIKTKERLWNVIVWADCKFSIVDTGEDGIVIQEDSMQYTMDQKLQTEMI